MNTDKNKKKVKINTNNCNIQEQGNIDEYDEYIINLSVLLQTLDCVPEKTEIEKIEAHTLEITNRILKNLREAREIGSITGANLYQQGKQFENAGYRIADMENNLNENRENIKILESGIIKQFILQNLFNTTDKKCVPPPPQRSKSKSPLSITNSLLNFISNKKPKEEDDEKFTDSINSVQKQILKNMKEIDEELKRLNYLADEFIKELDKQNPYLKELYEKLVEQSRETKNQNDRLHDVMRK